MVNGSNLNLRFTGERKSEWVNKILWCDWTDTRIDNNGKTNLVFKGRTNNKAKIQGYNKKPFPVSPNDLLVILTGKFEDKSPETIFNENSFDYDCSLSTVKDIFCLHNMGKIDTWFMAQAEQPQYWSETYNATFGHSLDYDLFLSLTHRKEMDLFQMNRVSGDNFNDKRFKLLDSKVSPGISIYDKFHEDLAAELCTGNKQITRYAAIAVWRILHGDTQLIELCHDDYVSCFGED